MEVQIPSDVIKEAVRSVLPEVLSAYFQDKERELSVIPLLERLIRLEEELKALRLLEEERHATLLREMDKRFEALEKRFSFLQWLIVGGFTFLSFLITALNLFKG